MKISKRILTLLLAGIMVFGMAATAMAADNESPSKTPGSGNEGNEAQEPTTAEKFEAVNYGKVTISAGTGTIAEIKDETTQKLVVDQSSVVDEYIAKNFKDSKGNTAKVYATYAFDVQGVSNGQVSVELGNLDQTVQRLTNLGLTPKAYVSHYNTTSKKWESCWSDIKDGRITFKFDSYSPIYVAITSVATTNAGEAVNGIAYTATPTQNVATAPKTEDHMAGLLMLMGMAVVVAGVVTRRKMVA